MNKKFIYTFHEYFSEFAKLTHRSDRIIFIFGGSTKGLIRTVPRKLSCEVGTKATQTFRHVSKSIYLLQLTL